MRKKAVKNEAGEDLSTKEKIVNCAINLFSVKGFTETTTRELAVAADLTPGSLYFYFESKNAILEYILNDYKNNTFGFYDKEIARSKLKSNPTIDGIMDCLYLDFPEGKVEYYEKVLSVLMQEQYRNHLVRDFVSNDILSRLENNMITVYEILKDMNIVRKDADISPWVNLHSSILFAYTGRSLLGIGDKSPDFYGVGMIDLVRFTISQMLTICGVEDK